MYHFQNRDYSLSEEDDFEKNVKPLIKENERPLAFCNTTSNGIPKHVIGWQILNINVYPKEN